MCSSEDKNISYIKNHREIRRIFGNNIELRCQDEQLYEILFQEVALYPKADEQETDLILEIVPQYKFQEKLSEFGKFHALTISSKMSIRSFLFDDGKLIYILFSLKKPANLIHQWIQRVRSMEFNSREERIGQIIHEQVLVPALLFNLDIVPIHSSAVRYKGQTILFGGHGGVGKTSLELELCFHKAAHFIADDISAVSTNGKVYPNLSFPKIYGYNVEGQPEVKKRVVDSSDVKNQIHWKLHFLKGSNKVRRRISPAKLYKNVESQPVPLNRYLILKRYEGDHFKTEEISSSQAAEQTVNILEREFSGTLNSISRQNKTNSQKYTSKEITERWLKVLPVVFENVLCQVVYIPQKSSHKEFKDRMVAILS